MSEFSTLTDIIRKRRSIFPPSYTSKEISKETILQILENANHAPTHRKTEPWRFVVLQNQALEHLSEFLGNYYKENISAEDFSPMKFKKTKQKALKSASVIAICMKRDPSESVPEWEEIAAVACAVQNMWLTCTALGIGSYWSSPKSIHEMNDFLNLGEGERCLGLFYMGYPKEGEYSTERGGLEDKIAWL